MEHSMDDGGPAVIPRVDRHRTPVRIARRALRMQRWRRPSASVLIALALSVGASTPIAHALTAPSAFAQDGGGGDGGAAGGDATGDAAAAADSAAASDAAAAPGAGPEHGA